MIHCLLMLEKKCHHQSKLEMIHSFHCFSKYALNKFNLTKLIHIIINNAIPVKKNNRNNALVNAF
jgi:hypothetical protein